MQIECLVRCDHIGQEGITYSDSYKSNNDNDSNNCAGKKKLIRCKTEKCLKSELT